MTTLLLDDYPLIVSPALAVAIGLNEAIVLQQLHYWLKKSDHQHDGRTWIFNTYDQWQAQFPFWSYNTVRRTLKKLEDAGLVVVGNYNERAYDKTKWYSIDYDRLPTMGSDSHKASAQNEQINVSKMGRPVPETTREQEPTDKQRSVGATYDCPDCPKVYKTKGGLTRHRREKHGIDTRHPALAAYQDITQYSPLPVLREKIANTVTDCERWAEVVTAYVGCGWNPRNVKAMLDCYQRGEIPSTNGGGNGKAKNHRARRRGVSEDEGGNQWSRAAHGEYGHLVTMPEA